MLYCDAATFCRRRNDAGIMTDETGRRCAQESIDIIIMKNNYYHLFIIKIILITYLSLIFLFLRTVHDTGDDRHKADEADDWCHLDAHCAEYLRVILGRV